MVEKQVLAKSTFLVTREMSDLLWFRHRTRYLSEIAESNRKYDETALSQQQVAQKLWYFQKRIGFRKCSWN
jgi:methylmalonyl-CoA mutase